MILTVRLALTGICLCLAFFLILSLAASSITPAQHGALGPVWPRGQMIAAGEEGQASAERAVEDSSPSGDREQSAKAEVPPAKREVPEFTPKSPFVMEQVRKSNEQPH